MRDDKAVLGDRPRTATTLWNSLASCARTGFKVDIKAQLRAQFRAALASSRMGGQATPRLVLPTPDWAGKPAPELDGNMHHAAQQWAHWWPVVVNPCPGIDVCMPLVCVAMGQHTRWRHGMPVELVWLGWNHRTGYATCLSWWLGGDGQAVPPTRGWHKNGIGPKMWAMGFQGPWDGRKGTILALPLPTMHAGSTEQDLSAMFGALARGQRAAWLGCLERDVAQYIERADVLGKVYASLLKAGASISPGFDIRIECEKLDFAAGLGSDTDNSPAILARNRFQFAQSHPVFEGMRYELLRREVDAGLPALPLIAARLGCRVGVVQAASRVPQAVVEYESFVNFLCRPSGRAILDGASTAALDVLTTANWNTWYLLGVISLNLGPTLNEYNRNHPWRGNHMGAVCDSTDGPLLAHLGASLRTGCMDWLLANSWHRHPSRLGYLLSDMQTELVHPALIHSMADGQGQPADAGLNSTRTSLRLLATSGLSGIAKVVASYGRNHLLSPIPGHKALASDCWSVPCEHVNAPGLKTLRFLTNQGELDHEAGHMKNCIADYGRGCREARHAILSLGSWSDCTPAEWIPTSSAAIAVGSNGKAHVAQHRGVENSAPSLDDKQALSFWLAGIKAGQITFDKSVLRTNSAATFQQEVVEKLGQDWCTPASHDHRWDKWRRILGTRAPHAAAWMAGLVLPAGMQWEDHALLLSRMQSLQDHIEHMRTAMPQPAPAQP